MIGYDGRRFSPAGDRPGPRPVAHYHQQDDLLWGEFAGGDVRRGSLAGTSDEHGVLRFAYCMVLDGGQTIAGVCHSVPEILADGRIRLTEHWQRLGEGTGTSFLEELPESSPVQHQA